VLAGQSYDNAPADQHLKEQLAEDICALDQISTTLIATRGTNGAMSLTRDELTFQFGEDQIPTAVTIRQKKPIRKIIREFKILADVSVAQKISSCFPEQTILRRQAPPVERKIVSNIQDLGRLCSKRRCMLILFVCPCLA
jgi:exoribonuclease R